jgi:molybdate transport system ATP-binding protein
VLYVSHDLSEIERLADRMVFLQSGRVVAAGPLNELLTDSSLPLMRGSEASSVLETHVSANNPGDGLSALVIDGATLLVRSRVGKAATLQRVRIAANDISLAVEPPSPTTILNVVPVRVQDLYPLDDAQINVMLTIGHRENGPKLLSRITRRSQNALGFVRGQDIYAQIKAITMVGPVPANTIKADQ